MSKSNFKVQSYSSFKPQWGPIILLVTRLRVLIISWVCPSFNQILIAFTPQFFGGPFLSLINSISVLKVLLHITFVFYGISLVIKWMKDVWRNTDFSISPYLKALNFSHHLNKKGSAAPTNHATISVFIWHSYVSYLWRPLIQLLIHTVIPVYAQFSQKNSTPFLKNNTFLYELLVHFLTKCKLSFLKKMLLFLYLCIFMAFLHFPFWIILKPTLIFQ